MSLDIISKSSVFGCQCWLSALANSAAAHSPSVASALLAFLRGFLEAPDQNYSAFSHLHIGPKGLYSCNKYHAQQNGHER